MKVKDADLLKLLGVKDGDFLKVKTQYGYSEWFVHKLEDGRYMVNTGANNEDFLYRLCDYEFIVIKYKLEHFDRILLENIGNEYKDFYLTRDKSGTLFLHKKEPMLLEKGKWLSMDECFEFPYPNYFMSIKFDIDEPYTVRRLLDEC